MDLHIGPIIPKNHLDYYDESVYVDSPTQKNESWTRA